MLGNGQQKLRALLARNDLFYHLNQENQKFIVMNVLKKEMKKIMINDNEIKKSIKETYSKIVRLKIVRKY